MLTIFDVIVVGWYCDLSGRIPATPSARWMEELTLLAVLQRQIGVRKLSTGKGYGGRLYSKVCTVGSHLSEHAGSKGCLDN